MFLGVRGRRGSNAVHCIWEEKVEGSIQGVSKLAYLGF